MSPMPNRVRVYRLYILYSALVDLTVPYLAFTFKLWPIGILLYRRCIAYTLLLEYIQ